MNVVIVEDEYMVAQRLSRFVTRAFADDLSHLSVFDSLDLAQDYVDNHMVDVLFLDLNLHGHDGFTLLKEQLSKRFHTIVVSANTDRAIEAFEYGVLDFVAKPFTQQRIDKAVSRLFDEHAASTCKFVSYRQLGEIKLLPIDDILYIRAAGHYSDIITQDGKTIVHDKSLDKLTLQLGNGFTRIHRSYTVKITSIRSINSEEGSKYSLSLFNKECLPVGRTRVKTLKALFD